MHASYSMITPCVVRTEVQAALNATLSLKAYGRSVTAAALSNLLVLIAATGSSLFGCVRRFGFGFCHETARKAINANLPKQHDSLCARLVDALHDVLSLSRRDRRRSWKVAIDSHYCPYYGKNPQRTPGVVGGQKKQGSKYFYAYATAMLVHRRRRYTVGLLPLTGKIKPHEIVAALLEQIESHGLSIAGVVLDSGFDSGDTLLLLQGRQLSYSVPLRRKGKGSNKRNACFTLAPGTVSQLQWTTEQSRQPVTTAIFVHRGGAKQPEIKVYAFAGWNQKKAASMQRAAWLARRNYRLRFGIETSYRQKNQACGKTTKKSVVYRLLLTGLALLLRQVWVRLTQLIAQARKAKPSAWIGELPLATLLDWLADEVKRQYTEHKSIPLENLDARET